MCLSTSCLAISKYCRVKPSYKVLNHLFTDTIIDLLLLGNGFKYMVVCKEVVLTKNFLFVNDSNFSIHITLRWIIRIGIIVNFQRSESDKSLYMKLRGSWRLQILIKSNDIYCLVYLRLWSLSWTYFQCGFRVWKFEI